MKKNLKRTLALALAACTLLALTVTSWAAGTGVTVTLDGKSIGSGAYLDSQNRTQIPNAMGNALGMEVVEENTATTFTKDGKSITFQFGSNQAGTVTMDTQAVVGYTPLRYLADFFGYDISWDATSHTAALTSPVATGPSVEKLPTLVYSELEALMQQQAAKYASKDNVMPMLWQGLLEMDIAVGETTRTAKLYVPQDSPQGSMFVVMNVPAGQDTLTFMQDSGWMAKADAEDFCLFVMEPANGTWGSPADEQAYINAAIGAQRGGKWLQPGPSLYLVGYGEIGADLQKYAMENPIAIAGAVFLDASQIDAEYLSTNGDISFDTETKTYNVTRKEVPVPVKLVDAQSSDESKAVLSYWQAAANDANAVTRFAPEGKAILDAAVKSEEKSYDYTAPATTDMAWDFLGQFYRYGGGVLSNAISWKVDYDKLGVEIKSFTDSQGIDRQYLVYIPAAYRGSEKLPVVVAYHGASTSMRNYFENTLWYNIADEQGIMLVFPESTLVPVPGTLGGGEANPTAYRALWQVENPDLKLTDAVYANDLLDQLVANYSQVDESRIYCTGHSMGCMMTHYLGSTDVSHRFAAMGATSGPLMAKEDTGTQVVPMLHTMAEYDMWSYDLSIESSMTINAVNMWLIRNGFATEENVAEVRQNPSKTSVDGRWNNSVWENANGQPLFRYIWVTGKDHVNMPSENQLIWDEWFSHFTLDTATGTRSYDGTPIQ